MRNGITDTGMYILVKVLEIRLRLAKGSGNVFVIAASPVLL